MIKKLPLDIATKPRNGECLIDRYWISDDEGIYWYARSENSRGWSPQCNSNNYPQLLKMYPEARFEFIPIVYAGHWDEEYGFNPF